MKRNKLGFFLREIRNENNDNLVEMAKKLNVTPSFISSVESGRRKLPESMAEQIEETYHLDHTQSEKLETLVMESSPILKIDMKDLSEKQRELAVAFVKSVGNISETKINVFMNEMQA